MIEMETGVVSESGEELMPRRSLSKVGSSGKAGEELSLNMFKGKGDVMVEATEDDDAGVDELSMRPRILQASLIVSGLRKSSIA